MSFELPELPYAMNGLVPYISEETLSFHYGKHQRAYVNKLNALAADTEYAEMDLVEVIRNSDGAIFNNAAQIWNHTFYWYSMAPNPKGQENIATGDLAAAIDKAFDSFDSFKDAFTAKATSLFGSGWTWLVLNKLNKLEIINTQNAETPISDPDVTPILTCDVWEHAYYLDTQNLRPKYVANFWEIVNWEEANKRFNKEA
jgi:Fe-Mn family superoxide dismutase